MLNRILERSQEYFSDGRLNSEGRKAFEIAVREAIKQDAGFKRLFRKARKRGDLEALVALRDALLEACGESSVLVD